MNTLAKRVDLFDEFLNDFPFGYLIKPFRGEGVNPTEKIKLDIKENKSNFVVHAEMPGVDKDDIRIEIDRNSVTISAEVRQFSEEKDDKSVRSERYFGETSRNFLLPVAVDPGKAKAKYKSGILTLTLPKDGSKSAKQITIE